MPTGLSALFRDYERPYLKQKSITQRAMLLINLNPVRFTNEYRRLFQQHDR